MKNYILCLVLSLGLFANAANAVDVTDTETLGPYYQKSGLDLADYAKVYIAPLGVTATLVLPPPWVTPEERATQRWALTNADDKWLRESYQTAMRNAIGPNIEIVEGPGPGVLMVRIELISLMPFARKGEDVQTQGFGIMVAQVQLRDGGTGELLAVYEGSQRVGRQYQQNTRLNSENSLRKVFEIWGTRVSMYMQGDKE